MSAVKAMMVSRPVAYYPELARAVGGIAPALFFQQIAHWQGRNADGWVFRTQEELEEELAMSPKVQAAAREHLVKRGLLEEKRDGMPRRLYYRPVWDNLESVLQTCHREGTDSPDGQVQTSPKVETTLKSIDESKEPSSPKGASAPTKDRITLLVDRCREVDFEPTPKQKQTWAGELKAKSRKHLHGRELMRLVNLIARAGADGYFWSFSRAERELGKSSRTAIGPARVPGDDRTREQRAKERSEQVYELYGKRRAS